MPHVIILLADGQQEGALGDPVAEAESIKAAGTEIFSVGVGGGPNIAQLNAIASDPDSTHVFSVDDFNGLAAILNTLVGNACPTATSTPSAAPTGTATPTSFPDGDGDGCTEAQEAAMGFDPNAWWDFYDVPVPANPDPIANGTKSQTVVMADVFAVLFYTGTGNNAPPTPVAWTMTA